MVRDPDSPATKKDIRLLMEQVGKFYTDTFDTLQTIERRLAAVERWNLESLRRDLCGVQADIKKLHESATLTNT